MSEVFTTSTHLDKCINVALLLGPIVRGILLLPIFTKYMASRLSMIRIHDV